MLCLFDFIGSAIGCSTSTQQARNVRCQNIMRQSVKRLHRVACFHVACDWHSGWLGVNGQQFWSLPVCWTSPSSNLNFHCDRNYPHNQSIGFAKLFCSTRRIHTIVPVKFKQKVLQTSSSSEYEKEPSPKEQKVNTAIQIITSIRNSTFFLTSHRLITQEGGVPSTLKLFPPPSIYPGELFIRVELGNKLTGDGNFLIECAWNTKLKVSPHQEGIYQHPTTSIKCCSSYGQDSKA